ncbi:MAG: hypothetical protein LBJ00_17845 [Planctomycetaceae bacterium]|nr:hypothetical protein [Planctomycetaceae bacterium]
MKISLLNDKMKRDLVFQNNLWVVKERQIGTQGTNWLRYKLYVLFRLCGAYHSFIYA